MMLLLGRLGGCGSGSVIDACLHQTPVVGGPRGDGGKEHGGVWGLAWMHCCRGHGWVVDVADPGCPGGQTPVIIS